MKGHLDVKDLETYKKADIQKLARDLGVSDAGTVKEIAARCATVEVDIPDDNGQTAEEKAAAEAAAKEAEEKAAAEAAAKEAEEKAAAEAAAKEAEEKAAEAAAKEAEEKAAAEAAAKAAKEKAGNVVIIQTYDDKQLKRIVEAGETLTVDAERANLLISLKLAKAAE